MAETIAALLELWSIDQKRRHLAEVRTQAQARLVKAEAAWKAATAAAGKISEELQRLDALMRQYQADLERCERTISELSGKKQHARSNREYMEIHNAIEMARAEKAKRAMSVKELGERRHALAAKLADAESKASAAQASYEAERAAAAAVLEPSPEERDLHAQAEAIKTRIDPEFLAVYERLVKNGHRSPLLPVDPKTRTTPFGVLLSHHQLEQLRQGKLVIDRTTNAILYLPT
ncbi:MAG: hypothetical protein RMM29_07360 [Planctomycetota bacterium]|nr:hypothetical protein [Planctomycetota bacterium]MDW8373449.1 hypothetical protein [Planctomycetota bacterium]